MRTLFWGTQRATGPITPRPVYNPHQFVQNVVVASHVSTVAFSVFIGNVYNMDKQSFAQRLQNLHANEYPGQSVRDAALESGISYRTLGGLMNGTGSKPTFATLTKLAQYYDVSVDYIVNGPQETEAPTAAAIDEIRGLLHELEFKLNELEQRSLHTPPPSRQATQTPMK